MSDEIFVMKEGEIVQSGTPIDIYDEPLNNYVADFIGESNIVKGTMIRDYKVEFAGKVFDCVDGGMNENETVEVVIRPEDLVMTRPSLGNMKIIVQSQLFRGVHYEIIGEDPEGNEWMVHTTRKAEVGEEVGLAFEPRDIHIMRIGETEEAFNTRLSEYAVVNGTMVQETIDMEKGVDLNNDI